MKRKLLTINGVQRAVVYDETADRLVDVLRRMGLTGTKVGCGKAQCGACSVVLDGELKKACALKADKVRDYAQITTIEGIGTPEKLHPIQAAWIYCGGVQCGYCTPGFIVSAYVLLMKNPSPGREDVREWFRAHRNACRCTGYKPLVDAVMEAAAILRGEKTVEDIAFHAREDGRIFGTNYPRPDAVAKVTGMTDFGDDVNEKLPEGTLYLAPVFPGVSRGRLLGIDADEALRMPGVRKLITAADVRGTNRLATPIGLKRARTDGFDEPVLADDIICHAGDVVALVAADTRRQAREAAKKVVLRIEPLPAYMTALEAMAEDASEIHPGCPNVFAEQPHFLGEDTRRILPEAAHVAEGSFFTPRQPHLTIEPDCGLGYVDGEGRLTLQSKSLALYGHIGVIAPAIGWPEDRFRVIQNPAGGSFGYTFSAATEALLGAAVIACGGAPCALTFSYEEHQKYTGKRSPAYTNIKLAADESGRLTAMEYQMVFDKGAYSQNTLPLIAKASGFLGFPYRIPNIMGLARAVYSNHAYAIPYRAYGTVEAATGTETMMDIMAEKCGMDPLQFRLKNVLREGDTNGSGHRMDVYSVARLLELTAPHYEEARARCRRLSDEKLRYGVGLAVSTYKVGGGPGDRAEVALELDPDGGVTVYNTWEKLGQGGDIGSLMHAHEALRPLGLRPEQIRLVQNDTAVCPNSGPAAGSRSHVFAGNATLDAAEKLLAAMRREDGSYRSYAEMTAEGIPTKYTGSFSYEQLGLPLENLDPNSGLGWPTPLFIYNVILCEVSVRTDSGQVRVERMKYTADVGTVGSTQAVEGQAFGGMEHGIGFALGEQFADPRRDTNLAASGFPYIDRIPDRLEADFVEEFPREFGPHGSSGCCEGMQTSAHVAVGNAVYDACGVRVYRYPITPESILEGLAAKEAGTVPEAPRYKLVDDFYRYMDAIAAHPV